MIDLSLLSLLIIVALVIWGISQYFIKFISHTDQKMIAAHSKLDTLLSHSQRRIFSEDDFNCQQPLVQQLLKHQSSSQEDYSLLQDLNQLLEIYHNTIDEEDLDDWQKYVNDFLESTTYRSTPLRFK